MSPADARRLQSPEQIGIPLTTETDDSKYFPVSNSAKEVRDKLLQACQRRGVKVRSANTHYAHLGHIKDLAWLLQCPQPAQPVS